VRTFVIGRSPFADVVLAEPTVDPHHAELVLMDNGGLHLTDCGSGAGTFRLLNGEWLRIRQAFITGGEPLKVGNHACTADELLRATHGSKDKMAGAEGWTEGEAHGEAQRRSRLRGRVQRDAQTGEIIRRRP
jgi:hypothetical protein